MKPYLVYLEWHDAIYNATWFDNDQLEQWAERSEFLIQEVGWVVKETKDYVALACGRKVEDDFTQEQWIGVHKIPKGWVKVKKKLSNK